MFRFREANHFELVDYFSLLFKPEDSSSLVFCFVQESSME